MASAKPTSRTASRKEREYLKRWRAKQKELARVANADGKHFRETVSVGVSGYHAGCRCDGCKKAISDYAKTSNSYANQRKRHAQRLKTDAVYVHKYRTYGREYERTRMKDTEYRKVVYTNNEARKRKIRDAIDQEKLNSGCKDCGWAEHAVGLDFDHVHPGKKKTVAQAIGLSKKTRNEELARSEVVCANCHRVRTAKRRKPESQNDWRARWLAKRKAMLAEIKVKAGCADCGYDEFAEALDFDHVRDPKLFTISKATFKKLEVLMAEVAKCDVVCARCHRIRTHETKVSGHRKK